MTAPAIGQRSASRGGHPVQARQSPGHLPGGQAIRNRSPPILPGVIREIDIWRVAVLMVNRYAVDAKANSDRHADELEIEGDHTRAAIWRRVTFAIERLTDTTGLPH